MALTRIHSAATEELRVIESCGEDELVLAIAEGSEPTLSIAYERHTPTLYGFAIRVLACTAQADDVVQHVFVRLWQQPERFDVSRGSLRSYLLAIAHRRAIDLIRTDERRRLREASAASNDQRCLVDETVVDLTTMEWISDGISRLPSRERQALELTYLQGYSYREAATMLGLPEGTVKSRIRSAIDRLRRLLDYQDV